MRNLNDWEIHEYMNLFSALAWVSVSGGVEDKPISGLNKNRQFFIESSTII